MIGGNSAIARRRAITNGRGWIPADLDLDATRAARRALDRDLDELERPAWLGPFDFTVISPNNRLDREQVDGYRALGVDRLIVLPGLDVPTERRTTPSRSTTSSAASTYSASWPGTDHTDAR